MERDEKEQEANSVRVRLVKTVIEYYTDTVLFELLDIDVLEPNLQNMLNSLLGFEAKAELVRDENIIERNILAGKISFIDGDGQEAGLKTVSFQIIPSASEMGPFDQEKSEK